MVRKRTLIKIFLYKLKEDIKRITAYPDVSLSHNPGVNYDKYWKSRRKGNAAALSSWQKQRADHILKMVERGSSVMDIGCGDGALLKYLIDNGGMKGIGVDINASMLKMVQALGIETHLIDLRDLDQIESLPEVDYILGLEILEHMPEPEALIINLSLKVRKGMIFSFPNTGYYLHRLRLLFGKFPLQWILHPGEHLRFWTARDVKWWINSLGFILDRFVLYEGLPGLNKIFPTLFGQGIIIKIHNEK